jgi:heme exporter protein A
VGRTGGSPLTTDGKARVFELALESVSKSYGARQVLRSVSATVRTGQVLAITGPNGSGKSTLIKVACRLVRPTHGQVLWKLGGKEIPAEAGRKIIGFISPDLVFYDELTAAENLRFFAQARGIKITDEDIESALRSLHLRGRGADVVGSYSSGMKQRLKYAFALQHDPPLLLLDEPTANLDTQGVSLVHDLIEDSKRSKCIVIATNEPEEVGLGDIIIKLGA